MKFTIDGTDPSPTNGTIRVTGGYSEPGERGRAVVIARAFKERMPESPVYIPVDYGRDIGDRMIKSWKIGGIRPQGPMSLPWFEVAAIVDKIILN